jgi:hypothetical protein
MGDPRLLRNPCVSRGPRLTAQSTSGEAPPCAGRRTARRSAASRSSRRVAASSCTAAITACSAYGHMSCGGRLLDVNACMPCPPRSVQVLKALITYVCCPAPDQTRSTLHPPIMGQTRTTTGASGLRIIGESLGDSRRLSDANGAPGVKAMSRRSVPTPPASSHPATELDPVSRVWRVLRRLLARHSLRYVG